MHTIFVYGTLKRGFGNNTLLQRGEAEFLGEATTVDRMYLCQGGIPYASRQAPDELMAFPIKGEAYRVDDETLNALDRLEGHPHHYIRTPTTVLLVGEDRPINAEIYLMERQFAGSFPIPCPVRDGSYVWGGYDDGRW